MAAFWIDDAGGQRIVHLGSGSGSLLSCVLAEAPVDFLRLLAIGYGEICWNEEFDRTPAAAENGSLDEIHGDFQNWVRDEFDVTIPETASEIVRHPAEMDDAVSEDDFHCWLSASASAE